ncbi:adrenodoxin-like [Gadus macrocephalus]|uniref:adrenodoxin-like n=1 Tax=Gadus macrocephalus TaxID=80720 RepID=UPI0028CB1C6E|nr:adrenodoxin-like [Gadus macrocephalus]
MALVTATSRLLRLTIRVSPLRTAAVASPRYTTLCTPGRTDAQGACCVRRRDFTTCTQRLGSDNKVTVHFVNRDGEKITARGSPGDSLLDLVINEDLDFDGFGACEGTLACSTCHLVFSEEVYEKLGPVTDEEMDMLDLAYGLTDTSRLGCQVCLTRALEGMEARVPESVADIRQTQDSSS